MFIENMRIRVQNVTGGDHSFCLLTLCVKSIV